MIKLLQVIILTLMMEKMKENWFDGFDFYYLI
jgi:hypothetical protein